MKKGILSAVVLILAVAGVILSQTSTQNPHGKLKWDCQDCHTSASWSEMKNPSNFNHDETGFHLTGAHAAAQCIGCHKTPQFDHVGVACIDCHTDQHQGQLGLACQNCHTPRDWQSRKDVLELHAQKGFPLTGVHAVADCESCHRGHAHQEYAGTPMDCIGCHADAFAATTDPSHTQAGFSQNCETCHHAASGTWSNATYTHKTFVLQGAHKQLDCKSCHANGYANTSTSCYDCHANDFAGTTNPNHVQSGFDHQCTLCHTTTAWSPATFDHNSTSFPLTGKHLTAKCIDCHASGYAGTSTACYSCHQTDFAGTTDPNHITNNFDHNCASCHTTAGWSPASFDHNATGFPLTGAHAAASVKCIDCHAGGYTSTSTNCYSCHKPAYDGATDPNHTAAGFGTDCQTCHTTTNWTSSTWNHNSSTPYALTGAHTSTDCIACHTTVYAGTSSTCYACHQSTYAGATNPNHASAGFPTDCQTCHTTANWTSSTWNHNTSTSFALTGAHASASVKCTDCHTTGFPNTPSTCYGCHKSTYDGATDPNHTAAGFGIDCQTCHTTTNWTSSTWNHNSSTSFALTGAHTSATCIACHSTVYAGTSSTCYACHKTDYDGTNNPNHAAANFPTDCQTCHSTSNWTSTTWNHDAQYFPIYSGTHNGRWNLCSDCHVNQADFATFECINCHEHSKSNTDSHHTNVNNYQYLSTACYSCHPRGRAD